MLNLSDFVHMLRDGFLRRLDERYHRTGNDYRRRLLSVEKRVVKHLKKGGAL